MRTTFTNEFNDNGHAQGRLLNEDRLMSHNTYTTAAQGLASLRKSSAERFNQRLLIRLAMAVLGIAGFAGAVNASSITVTNPSFEYPAGANGIVTKVLDGSDPATGWVRTDGGQIYNPGDDANAQDGLNSYIILDGNFSAFDTGSGSIMQELDDVLEVGDYTLQVEVGENTTASSVFGSYRVQLGVMSEGVFLPLSGAEDNNSLSPSGEFLTSTVNYSASDADTNVGLHLAIRLEGTVESGINNQVLFDNVRLDFVPGPGDRAVWLKTLRIEKELPGGGTVAMWGFVSCTENWATCSTDPDAPGPRIDAFADYDLTINVRNTLPTEVSIMIPGQLGAGAPTTFIDGQTKTVSRHLTRRSLARADRKLHLGPAQIGYLPVPERQLPITTGADGSLRCARGA